METKEFEFYLSFNGINSSIFIIIAAYRFPGRRSDRAINEGYICDG